MKKLLTAIGFIAGGYLSFVCEASLNESNDAQHAVEKRLQDLKSGLKNQEQPKKDIIIVGASPTDIRWVDFYPNISELAKFVFVSGCVVSRGMQQQKMGVDLVAIEAMGFKEIFNSDPIDYGCGVKIYKAPNQNLTVQMDFNDEKHTKIFKEQIKRSFDLILTDRCVFYFMRNVAINFFISLLGQTGTFCFGEPLFPHLGVSSVDAFDPFNYFITNCYYFNLQQGKIRPYRLNVFDDVDHLLNVLTELKKAVPQKEYQTIHQKLLSFFEGGIPRIEQQISEMTSQDGVNIICIDSSSIPNFLPLPDPGWRLNDERKWAAVVFGVKSENDMAADKKKAASVDSVLRELFSISD